MRGVPRRFVTAICTLAVFFSSLQLCVAKIVYAEKGSSVELPCPCPNCPEQHREVNWYFDQKGAAVSLFRKVQRDAVKRYPAAWDRLEMLPNYSLHLSNVTDTDTCRYWCEPHNYYDLVVVTGAKQTVESRRADSVCYILSCSVSAENIQHSVISWWEGKKELQDEKKREISIFKGKRASQLHICLKKEGTGTKERRVKCSFHDQMGITFSLTAVRNMMIILTTAAEMFRSQDTGLSYMRMSRPDLRQRSKGETELPTDSVPPGPESALLEFCDVFQTLFPVKISHPAKLFRNLCIY